MKVTHKQLRQMIREQVMRDLISEQRSPSSHVGFGHVDPSTEPTPQELNDLEFVVDKRTTSTGDETDRILVSSDLGSEWFLLHDDPLSLTQGSTLTGYQLRDALDHEALVPFGGDDAGPGVESPRRLSHHFDGDDAGPGKRSGPNEGRRLSRRQLHHMIREQAIREFGKDTLSKSRRGGRGEEADPSLDFAEADLYEDSGEEEGDHYRDDADADDKELEYLRHHLDKLQHDKDYDEEHVNESRRRQVMRLRRVLSEQRPDSGVRHPGHREREQMLSKLDSILEKLDSVIQKLDTNEEWNPRPALDAR